MGRERCWRVGEACVAQLDARQRKTGLGASWVRSGGEEEESDISTVRATGTRYDGQVGNE